MCYNNISSIAKGVIYMFYCCDIFEQIRLQKYYSKPRKCEQCRKFDYLNYITGLCPICQKLYIDYLLDMIKQMKL